MFCWIVDLKSDHAIDEKAARKFVLKDKWYGKWKRADGIKKLLSRWAEFRRQAKLNWMTGIFEKMSWWGESRRDVKFVLAVGIGKDTTCILSFCFWHFVFENDVYGRSPCRRRFRPSPACILCRKSGYECQGSRKRPGGLDRDKVAASGKVRAVMDGKTKSEWFQSHYTRQNFSNRNDNRVPT